MTHRNLRRSNDHFARTSQRLPLGVASSFRYWGDDRTFYIARGEGGRAWDIDDNDYVDYRLGYGPAILGYADPRVDEAAREGMNVGGVFGLATELEFVVAERIARMVPTAEMVRYSNSGTEAVMAALRISRAYTGKDGFVMVEGGYHGLFDAVLWYSDVENWDGTGDPAMQPYSEGVPEIVKSLIYPVPLNDANRLEDLFKQHGDKIGTFLIEPMMGNCCSITATREYMQAVRELCDRFGVLMIIDEVKTGFRVAKGGIQELLGVEADLCTFAKAIANGYPISVVAGRREYMSKIGDGVAHGGTYTAHSVSIAAANKTLEILDETDALTSIQYYGTELQTGLSNILGQRGIPHSFVGHPSMFGLFFSESPPTNYRDWKRTDYSLYDRLALKLHDVGIIVEPDSREPWFMCEAHDKSCLSDTLERFEIALEATLDEHGQPVATTEG